MLTENDFGRISETRYAELGFQHYGKLWRIIDRQTGSAVGPHYKTKSELLADLDRYAAVYGALRSRA